MKKPEFIAAIEKLELDPEDYIVIGSGVLAVLGIREADDVDLIVSEDIFKEIEATGKWSRKDFDDGSHYLVDGIYEVGLDWDSRDVSPNLEDLKADELVIEGVPFVSLARLRQWKVKKDNPKSLEDVKLIDEYLARNR